MVGVEAWDFPSSPKPVSEIEGHRVAPDKATWMLQWHEGNIGGYVVYARFDNSSPWQQEAFAETKEEALKFILDNLKSLKRNFYA